MGLSFSKSKDASDICIKAGYVPGEGVNYMDIANKVVSCSKEKVVSTIIRLTGADLTNVFILLADMLDKNSDKKKLSGFISFIMMCPSEMAYSWVNVLAVSYPDLCEALFNNEEFSSYILAIIKSREAGGFSGRVEPSNHFVELKKELEGFIENNRKIEKEYIEKCEEFIQNIIFREFTSFGSFYQPYCSYITAIGITFVKDYRGVTYLSFDGDSLKLIVNAVLAIALLNSEMEILFVLAHEIQHLLDDHLIKYGNLSRDEVSRVFLNMIADVGVNEGLKSGLKVGYSISNEYVVPRNIYDLKSLSKTLDVPYSELEMIYSNSKSGFSESYPGMSLADILYSKLDDKCKTTLGYTTSEILYRIGLDKITSFKKEVLNVIDCGSSKIFDIKDKSEAIRFCKEIAKYLAELQHP